MYVEEINKQMRRPINQCFECGAALDSSRTCLTDLESLTEGHWTRPEITAD